eukprot:TRINITY_DN47139_c0_g1_i1.p2 TRINITY_DN47139_c0_g1~~TRINITY_DN47139_c0_g1_i1.p2  ORF type:complete len:175 (+),score=49.53 TRINITY_DN47139_c0_g1_i1:125-649(+)
MQCTLSAVLFVLACCVPPSCAEDYAAWKELRAHRTVVEPKAILYEGSAPDADACFEVAQRYPDPSSQAVSYADALQLCQIYNLSDLGVRASGGAVEWSPEATQEASPADGFALYAKTGASEGDDSHMSQGDVAATVILAAVFGVCLVACALNCKEEDSHIAAQLSALAEKDLAE